MGLRRLLTVMGLGAGLMYFYDPDEGRRRRALLGDQVTRFKNDSQNFMDRARRDLQNRRQGMQAEPITGGMGGLSGDWTPGVRLVAALAGGGMTVYGLAKSGLSGVTATLLGINLLSHSVFDGHAADAANAIGEQLDQAKRTAGERRSSDGKKTGRQEESASARAGGQSSRTSASLTSEQGANPRQYQRKESSTGMAGSSRAERDAGQESVGFDGMLPGNPPEGSVQ